MSQKKAQWNSKRTYMIAQYGTEKMLKAYRLNRVDGEGETAIADYTGIPLRQVNAAIRVGEELIAQ